MWSEWTEWTACDISKSRSRTKRCDSPQHLCGGDPCEGKAIQSGVCCQDPGVYYIGIYALYIIMLYMMCVL